MVNKRPFHDDGIYEVGCKNPRQQEDPEPYISEGIAHCHSPQNPTSDEGERNSKKYRNEEKTMTGIPSEYLYGAKEELWGNASSSNGNADDEHVNPAASFHLSFFQHLFELGHQDTGLAQPGQGYYSLLLEHDPQKIVPVGTDHQAVLPDWKPKGTTTTTTSTTTKSSDDFEEKLVGTCLVPMPDLESSCGGYSETRIVCSCLDMGSISCVRLHVTEAREKLREELGQKFGRLGLCDMGEEVAQKWSEEEERCFYEAVCSSPASSGKNFWHILPSIFPTRTKQELVNYYFNVFMLRKRAAQNRFDPQNIDSDDDEWQVSATDAEDDSLAEGEGIKMEGGDEPEEGEKENHYSVVEESSFDQFGLPRGIDDDISGSFAASSGTTQDDSCMSFENQIGKFGC